MLKVATKESGSESIRGARVLVVDDTIEMCKLIKRFLDPHGAKVQFAHTGKDALSLIAKQPPDVAIIDMVMPGMNGIDLCEKLKNDYRDHFIPVVMISGQADDDAVIQAIEAGAADFLPKPVQSGYLLARIRNSLHVKRLHDEVVSYKSALEDRVAERTRQLVKTQHVTAFSLARLSESRDTETGAHLERIRLYVRILAETMKAHPDFAPVIDDAYVDNLYFSSPLHDIGKVGIPDEILLKPGKLTEEEFEIMKWHTRIGGDTLEEADREAGESAFLEMAKVIAYAHHEKWDGSGYPEGLKEEAIPLSARIVALADVYDALSSKRPYKEAMDHDTVKDILLKGNGNHFDPRIIDAFLKAEDRFVEIRQTHYDDDDGVPKLQRLIENLQRLRDAR